MTMGRRVPRRAAGGVVGSVLCRFADGRMVRPELVDGCAGGGARSDGLVAAGAKLRRVGPTTTASGGPAVCAGRAATRAWCGPGGYIQVGMRECEPGGEVRAP